MSRRAERRRGWGQTKDLFHAPIKVVINPKAPVWLYFYSCLAQSDYFYYYGVPTLVPVSDVTTDYSTHVSVARSISECLE